MSLKDIVVATLREMENEHVSEGLDKLNEEIVSWDIKGPVDSVVTSGAASIVDLSMLTIMQGVMADFNSQYHGEDGEIKRAVMAVIHASMLSGIIIGAHSAFEAVRKEEVVL